LQEKEWAEYLFQDGSMIGLNKDILCQYVEYITNLRMAAVGLQPAFAGTKQNPIPGSTPGSPPTTCRWRPRKWKQAPIWWVRSTVKCTPTIWVIRAVM
jgi:hypothetical protein